MIGKKWADEVWRRLGIGSADRPGVRPVPSMLFRPVLSPLDDRIVPAVTGLFNTGVDNNNVPLAGASPMEQHYQLVSSADPNYPAPGTTTAYAVDPSSYMFTTPKVWVPNSATSRWIAPQPKYANFDGTNSPAGVYDYRLTLQVTGNSVGTYLSGTIGADDGVAVSVNKDGVNDLTTKANAAPNQSSLTPFTLTAPLKAGENTLDFFVTNSYLGGNNGDKSPTGLRVEGLTVAPPANLMLWVATGQNGTNFYTAANWSGNRLPTDNDILVFDPGLTLPNGQQGTNTPCMGASLTPPGGAAPVTSFGAIVVAPKYTQKITQSGYLITGTLAMAGTGAAAIDAPDAADTLKVSGNLNWTGGTLNSTGTLSTVFAQGMTVVAPAQGQTPATGDNLNITGTAVFLPGTVAFNNNATLSLMAPTIIFGGVTFTATNPSNIFVGGGGSLVIKQGTGGTTFASALPLFAQGATVQLEGGVTANFQQVQSGQPAGSFTVQMSGGELDLRDGSTLQALNGVEVDGGTVKTLLNNGNPAETATIKTAQFKVIGGTLQIGATLAGDPTPTRSPSAATLHCTGDVIWSGTTLKITAATPAGGQAGVSLWKIDGALQVSSPTVALLPTSAPIALNSQPTFINAAMGITGTPPAQPNPVDPSNTGTYFINNDKFNWKLLRKT